MQNGTALTGTAAQYTRADYGSDNGNSAWFWNPATSAWTAEPHADNCVIDLTQITCYGTGILSRGLNYAI